MPEADWDRVEDLEERELEDAEICEDLVEVYETVEDLSSWEADFIESMRYGKGPLTAAQREKAREIIEKYL